MINALTIDVEDYFQVEAFKDHIDRNKWDQYSVRVEKNVSVILALLSEKKITATFFILAWIAERYPELVKKIHAEGHEIGSHGYDHKLIYLQKPKDFFEETVRSKKTLEDLVGDEVLGYRAATFSITHKSLWAIDSLIEAGFKYDSSIYPGRHDRYGLPGSPTEPYVITTDIGEITEFPVSVLRLWKGVMPIAGGGYFRLFPYWFSRWAYQKINRSTGPFMFYLHPWEVDPDQPRIDGISRVTAFRHYINLVLCEKKLTKLTNDFEFTSLNNVLVRLSPANKISMSEKIDASLRLSL